MPPRPGFNVLRSPITDELVLPMTPLYYCHNAFGLRSDSISSGRVLALRRPEALRRTAAALRTAVAKPDFDLQHVAEVLQLRQPQTLDPVPTRPRRRIQLGSHQTAWKQATAGSWTPGGAFCDDDEEAALAAELERMCNDATDPPPAATDAPSATTLTRRQTDGCVVLADEALADAAEPRILRRDEKEDPPCTLEVPTLSPCPPSGGVAPVVVDRSLHAVLRTAAAESGAPQWGALAEDSDEAALRSELSRLHIDAAATEEIEEYGVHSLTARRVGPALGEETELDAWEPVDEGIELDWDASLTVGTMVAESTMADPSHHESPAAVAAAAAVLGPIELAEPFFGAPAVSPPPAPNIAPDSGLNAKAEAEGGGGSHPPTPLIPPPPRHVLTDERQQRRAAILGECPVSLRALCELALEESLPLHELPDAVECAIDSLAAEQRAAEAPRPPLEEATDAPIAGRQILFETSSLRLSIVEPAAPSAPAGAFATQQHRQRICAALRRVALGGWYLAVTGCSKPEPGFATGEPDLVAADVASALSEALSARVGDAFDEHRPRSQWARRGQVLLLEPLRSTVEAVDVEALFARGFATAAPCFTLLPECCPSSSRARYFMARACALQLPKLEAWNPEALDKLSTELQELRKCTHVHTSKRNCYGGRRHSMLEAIVCDVDPQRLLAARKFKDVAALSQRLSRHLAERRWAQDQQHAENRRLNGLHWSCSVLPFGGAQIIASFDAAACSGRVTAAAVWQKQPFVVVDVTSNVDLSANDVNAPKAADSPASPTLVSLARACYACCTAVDTPSMSNAQAVLASQLQRSTPPTAPSAEHNEAKDLRTDLLETCRHFADPSAHRVTPANTTGGEEWSRTFITSFSPLATSPERLATLIALVARRPVSDIVVAPMDWASTPFWWTVRMRCTRNAEEQNAAPVEDVFSFRPPVSASGAEEAILAAFEAFASVDHRFLFIGAHESSGQFHPNLAEDVLQRELHSLHCSLPCPSTAVVATASVVTTALQPRGAPILIPAGSRGVMTTAVGRDASGSVAPVVRWEHLDGSGTIVPAHRRNVALPCSFSAATSLFPLEVVSLDTRASLPKDIASVYREILLADAVRLPCGEAAVTVKDLVDFVPEEAACSPGPPTWLGFRPDCLLAPSLAPMFRTHTALTVAETLIERHPAASRGAWAGEAQPPHARGAHLVQPQPTENTAPNAPTPKPQTFAGPPAVRKPFRPWIQDGVLMVNPYLPPQKQTRT